MTSQDGWRRTTLGGRQAQCEAIVPRAWGAMGVHQNRAGAERDWPDKQPSALGGERGRERSDMFLRPNKGMELIAYNVRSFLAPASSSSSYLALGIRSLRLWPFAHCI
jgi:hypothetical protein